MLIPLLGFFNFTTNAFDVVKLLKCVPDAVDYWRRDKPIINWSLFLT